jgi:O-antigen/teichoic acid export membrane protein
MTLNSALLLGEKVVFGGLAIMAVWTAWVGDPVLGVLAALLVSRLLWCGLQWGQVLAAVRLEPSGLRAVFREMLVANAPILGAALANLLVTHANQLLVEQTQGAAELAYYAVAFQIAALVILLQGQVIRWLTPRISAVTRAGVRAEVMRRTLRRYAAAMFAITAATVFPLLIATREWLGLCFAPEYQAAAWPLRILCVWLLLYGPALVVNQFLLGLRLNRAYLAVAVTGGVIAILLGWVLVPRYGAVGVAVTLLVSHTPSMAFQWFCVQWRIARADEGAGGLMNDRSEALAVTRMAA